ncbi:hypothetical protein QR680_007843 [Steinernema hermaphroditum]|uniref:Uncharacterized protein n=1 Tax=Steinernema hermaphroditum TaxID=289476 RepID=A0AA39M6L1_9BILA|nr:hypothetical protein QR680_007843 [Steinernema hermaphroditum]
MLTRLALQSSEGAATDARSSPLLEPWQSQCRCSFISFSRALEEPPTMLTRLALQSSEGAATDAHSTRPLDPWRSRR